MDGCYGPAMPMQMMAGGGDFLGTAVSAMMVIWWIEGGGGEILRDPWWTERDIERIPWGIEGEIS